MWKNQWKNYRTKTCFCEMDNRRIFSQIALELLENLLIIIFSVDGQEISSVPKKIVLIIRARGGSSKIYFFWAEKEFYLVRWNNHIFKISLINLQLTFFSFYSKDFDGFFFSHIIFSLHQRKFMKGKLVLISGWGIPHRPNTNLLNIKRCFWHLKISITLLLFRY